MRPPGRLSGPISPKIRAVRRPPEACQNVKSKGGRGSFYKPIEPGSPTRARPRSLSRLRGRAGVGVSPRRDCQEIEEDLPAWREPSPAALYERVGLSRKACGRGGASPQAVESMCDDSPHKGGGNALPVWWQRMYHGKCLPQILAARSTASSNSTPEVFSMRSISSAASATVRFDVSIASSAPSGAS